MKISGGEFKSRTIKTPKGNDTRPTSSITRQSIFNIIGNMVNDAYILDLYSGCGSFGIEAISRGASYCIFTEIAKIPLKCIEDNIEFLGISDKTKVLKRNLPKQISNSLIKKTPDIIFMDPPYSKGLVKETLKRIKEFELASKNTLIIAEHCSEETPDDRYFANLKTRKYGKSLVSFLNYMV